MRHGAEQSTEQPDPTWIDVRVMQGTSLNQLEPHRYQVPYTPGMVVLDAVRWIQEHETPDLAVRWNCKAAHCGSCSAEINGLPRLLCKTRVDAWQGMPIWVAPMKTFPLIKDLVTDVSWNYTVAKTIPPFTPAHPAPFRLYPEDIERLKEFHRCIECFLCQDTCHVWRDHNELRRYDGPRFMVLIASFEMHPLDTIDRVPLLQDEAGIGLCNVTACCTTVCPQGIRITDNAIIPLKERVADRYYSLTAIFKRLWNRAHPSLR